MSPPLIWWIRRDLRLTDNPALTVALERAEATGGALLPVFVLDPALLRSGWVGERRTAFLFGGLRALDAALRARGSRLIVRAGDPAEALAALCAECGAGGEAVTVVAERDHSPYARARDARVAACLPLLLVEGVTVHPPEAVRKPDGTPYTVFTPFSKRWKALGAVERAAILPAPERIETPVSIAGLPIPESPALDTTPFAPGEAEAKRRLAAFVGGDAPPIYRYALDRNRPDLEGTAQLSPYLRFGMISARLAALAAWTALARAPSPEAAKSAETWLNELIWREFYSAILADFPHVRQGAFRPEYDALLWLEDARGLEAWRAGQTGYPIVDAAMRQLAATGWMHNRTRMLTASFLVKDLLIDWRQGERWFMQQLVDGDPAANNGGWQWTAGVGTDAAPYFRIFSPVAQGQRFDPDGAYVRRWLPELARVPLEFVHAPWTMPLAQQTRAGCRIGRDYPAPLVDHAFARERVLAAFAAVRGAPLAPGSDA